MLGEKCTLQRKKGNGWQSFIWMLHRSLMLAGRRADELLLDLLGDLFLSLLALFFLDCFLVLL